ncbi:RUN and FYVE domain-containing protein 2-like isoform X1 [Lutzomyia longipalpis]|uniref:RUN and FYVE domain-containing protein 2-like isoform X1 n=1 Tax=Lutzomyia longipalpis TaxID=7200 RepID=UPI0024835057|nr:RUN and FYVE domain-containing protein 2-like isoform X1 [Lutzomyia longipalpis]XP_055695797.1 RUN and FYVE domain-containing protein 2-like isoform X1 [Lutzomyia longipalpis]
MREMRALHGNSESNNNGSRQIQLPKAGKGMEELVGAQDTIYLCNFRVSVDGEWLCLKELQDLDIQDGSSAAARENGVVFVSGSGDSAATNNTIARDNSRRFANFNARDPAAIERSNLVNICKLVVKELLEQSLRFGRMLDSDHLPLQHFFIVLEHVLRHGLKPKKGLLGPKKELWDILQSVEKYAVEAQDITASVRDLPTVRTQIGRARAWLRLALMQKKLADYLQALVDNRDEALAEYYEPHALMMSDEVILIMGILVGLNVIDCNLCVKEEDLDSQQGVIDFSLYLRSSTRTSPEDEVHTIVEAGNAEHMTAVLDQKNYIEELNRHLNATVANLQGKLESLTTTNALMKEDLAIARNSLLSLQAENLALRQSAQNPNANAGENLNVHDRIDPEVERTLVEEKKKRQDLERELELQVSLKAETEMAMKLLEKDIHEKQDTIVSLRRQLEDIKQINLEMYKKLQECESSLKHKTELLSKLEAQKEAMGSALTQLENKYSSETTSLAVLQDTSQTLSIQMMACEERAARVEADLRIEREWRNSLQEKEVKLKEQINALQLNVKELRDDAKKHEKVAAELSTLKRKWQEAQYTLEELGMQLSVSKLQISELKEKQTSHDGSLAGAADMTGSGVWAPDKLSSKCRSCNREFGITRRKHHCRNCGEIFCHNCSEQMAPLPNAQGQLGKPVRVCDGCWEVINATRN